MEYDQYKSHVFRIIPSAEEAIKKELGIAPQRGSGTGIVFEAGDEDDTTAPKIVQQIEKIKKEVFDKLNHTEILKGEVQVTPETAKTGEFGVDKDSDNPEDSLGYADYAEAIANILTHTKTETPITLGICAPWGMGKTVLLSQIQSSLLKYSLFEIAGRKPAFKDHLPSISICFDAWKYSKADQIWMGFMDVILYRLQEPLNWWQKLFLAYDLNKSVDSRLITNLKLFSAFISLFCIVYLSIVVLLYFKWYESLLGIGLIFSMTITYFWSTIIGFWKLINQPLTQSILNLISMPKYKQRLDPIHKIISDIKTAFGRFKKNTGIERIFVFIDDIDRCQPDKIMEVLEAMKHFLNIDGLVFIIAMDAKVVRFAIGEHYKFMGDGKRIQEDMGRFYLDKIIQIPFHLPKFRKNKWRIIIIAFSINSNPLLLFIQSPPLCLRKYQKQMY